MNAAVSGRQWGTRRARKGGGGDSSVNLTGEGRGRVLTMDAEGPSCA